MVGETEGHDVEAVLPGDSPDSVVVIVHYDSIGPPGMETMNPGADDDMSGFSAMMEAARVLSDGRFARAKTVRFVASDYEEEGGLEGARQYATYLQNESMTKGFQIVAAQDYEQSGWNCATNNVCMPSPGVRPFFFADCSGDAKHYTFAALGAEFVALNAAVCSPLTAGHGCMADNSDHYAMWEIGVPAVVTSEADPFMNPHFDQNGGDDFSLIDTAYHAAISRVVIAFTAELAGIRFANEDAGAGDASGD
jgi:Zn-dependent M28 family amino/carboxypeptidase